MTGGEVASLPVLLGRGPEQAILRRVLDDAPTHGSMVVITSPPGAGKSALLGWAAAEADRDFITLRAEGTAAEFDLPFGALHLLLRPVLHHADRLSPHRAEALAVAFGAASGSPPDLFAVAQAAFDVVVEASAQRPVLLMADDAHWMDTSSLQVLQFIGRRLGSDRVVVLAAQRQGPGGLLADERFLPVTLDALDGRSSLALLDRSLSPVDPAVRAFIVDVAQGNPLALLELPRTLTSAAQISGVGRVGEDEVPLTQRLEQSFLSRVREMPPQTQLALDLAALSPTGLLPEVLDAAALVSGLVSRTALDPAVSAGLVTVDDAAVVRFGHPLMRSAIHQRLTPGRLRAGHEALASCAGDPERGLWHRAAAADHPDAALSAALEQLADRAAGRGATADSVASLERAAQLSVEPTDKCRRIYTAACLAYAAGRTAHADRLRGMHRQLAVGNADRMRHEWLRELADTDHGGEQRVSELVGLAHHALDSHDRELALSFLRSAALRCWNFCADRPVSDVVVAAVERLDNVDDAARATLLAHAAPLRNAGRVIDIVTSTGTSTGSAGVDATALYRLGHAAACVGAFAVSDPLFTAANEALRFEGRLKTLGTVLALQSWSALRRGRWSTAEAAAEEGARLCAETEQPFWHASALAARAVIRAYRGDLATSDQFVEDAARIAHETDFAAADAVILVARATAASSRGDHASAFDHLLRLHNPTDPAHHPVHALWSLASLADAALMCGQTATVTQLLTTLGPDARTTQSPAVRMNLRYASAVLADDRDIEAEMLAALASDLTLWPTEWHRMQLAYGSWLRRGRRAAEARPHLRAARDGFERLGAEPWAERARQALRAAGERSLTPAVDVWGTLSPLETQIAAMAAQGLTNREIGERLFMSHRTVGSHLYRLFPKLGVTSRVDLVRLAAERGPGPPGST